MSRRTRGRSGGLIRAVGLAAVSGALSLALAVPAMADSSPVVRVNVAGQPTAIFGINQGLPPLVAATMGEWGYAAGSGLAPQIVAYHESGDFRRDQRAVNRAATSYLESYLDRHCSGSARCEKGRRAAAVFDIDDTLLSTYDTYAANGFSPSGATVDAAYESCAQTVIDSTRAFFNTAKDRKVTIFLITGRSDTLRAATRSCLAQAGISGYEELIMRDAEQQSLTAVDYKSAERARIERRGYRIITAIGDQISDSAGGATERGFLLPNPMYFIP